MPPKPGIHTRPDAFIHAMPAYNKSRDAAGMKWISGYPLNTQRGLPYISGLMILNDPDTGLPLAVMDATWITAMRTGAATAVAARYLARPESKTVAILGCGVQGRTNLQALQVVLKGLDNVRAYDINEEAANRFKKECFISRKIECTVCRCPEEAVRPADVVVTAGPLLRAPSPVIVPDWLKRGVFVCALDFDSYVTAAAFHAADLFCTDDLSQLRYYQKAGYLSNIPAEPVDLADIATGSAEGRKSASERVVSVNLGLAVEDLLTAHLIYRQALARETGVRLPL
jgi:ornithine cyclodeaminase/alanine dehydrogenase-like protein (mu-crystallin family)